jgi:tRNA modification GTPase
MLEELSGAIDFPDEVPDPDRPVLERRLADVAERLEALHRDGERGRLVREGVSVAIVGPPNAGKSSLLNALLGEDRAIVSETPGTTRDTIEDSIAVDGVSVRLVDTAGIRAHADRLEAKGIERTHRALAGARIALVVLDGSRPLDAEAYDVLAATKGRERIVFLNKADLGTQIALQGAIVGSAFDRVALEAIRNAIARLGWNGELPDLERPHLASLREFAAVNEALGALQRARATLKAGEPSDLCAGEVTRAFSALGHVCESVAAEEVLEGIFSRFCIGK